MSIKDYRNASYAASAHNLDQLLPDEGREVVFAGRSNAGKSSVINALTGQKRLAKISKTPGRTQLINFFPLDESRRLVDLPGYGFAKVPGKLQSHWAEILGRYFHERQSLVGVVMIADIRRLITEHDEQMLGWCEVVNLPVHVLLNKSDKLAFGARKKALGTVQRSLEKRGHSAQLFSVLKKQGIEELVDRLDAWLLE